MGKELIGRLGKLSGGHRDTEPRGEGGTSDKGAQQE